MDDEFIDLPVADSEEYSGNEYVESENTYSDSISATSDSSDDSSTADSGSNNAEVVERLDSLITTLNTSMTLEQYYNKTLGFYVFPDYETLIYYFPPEDGNLDDWVQASDNSYVPVAHLEEYETYLSSTEETEEITDSGMTDAELLEDINKVLHEQQDKLSIITSTVSGNGVITVSLDDTTKEMLVQIQDEQVAVKEECTALNSTLMLIFVVLVFDLLHRFAKRIIKNFMKGGDNND